MDDSKNNCCASVKWRILRNLSGTADMDTLPVSRQLETGNLFSEAAQPNKGEINMSNLTGLEQKIVEMAARIRELREIEGLSVAYVTFKEKHLPGSRLEEPFPGLCLPR